MDRSFLARVGSVKRSRIVFPILAGAALVGVSIVLILSVLKKPGQMEEAGSPPTAPLAISPEKPKWASSPVIEELSRPPPAPPGEGLDRWDFENPPEGFDPELAMKLAEFFKDMVLTDRQDAGQLERLLNAREELKKFLASLGPEAISTLSAILEAELDFVNRRFLLYALGDLGPKSEEATFALLDYYNKTKDVEQSQAEMNHVIKAMENLKNDSSYEAITREIDNPNTDSYFRDKFIKALGEHPRREESIPRIIDIMNKDHDVNCRNHAAQYLGKTENPDTLDHLISRYHREKSWFVRQTILGSIGKIGNPSSIPFLTEAAQNEDHRIRLSAGRALWRIGTDKAIDILRMLAPGERNDNNKKNFEDWIKTPPPSRSPKGQ